MIREPLNGPLEVGVRVLMILTEAYPQSLDLNRLVLLDHGVLHSADLGGPGSLHPPLPSRASELSVKRAAIEEGLRVIVGAGLAEMETRADGIMFEAGETAHSFVSALASAYAGSLRSRVQWVIRRFPDTSESAIRAEMQKIFDSWSEEFGPVLDGSSER